MDRQRLTRRTSLQMLTATAASVSILQAVHPTATLAAAAKKADISEEGLERAIKVIMATPSVDLHNHLGYWETKGITPPMVAAAYPGDAQTAGVVNAMIKGNAKCAWVVLTGDVPLVKLGEAGNKVGDYEEDQAWAEYQRQMGLLREFFETLPMTAISTTGEIEGVAAQGRLAVLLSTEGGHMIENDIDRLERLKADGLTKFQPIHYLHTKLGDNQTDSSAYGGMSSLGKQAIKKAAALGMVIDVAHASYDGAKHAADITGVPIMLSHTMMKFGPYLDNRPRFITKDYAFLVAQTGGVIGTWAVGDPIGVANRQEFFDGINRLADTVGIDHVGWSTDYISFAQPDWFDDYSIFPLICGGLIDSGFSDNDLAKFIGLNATRVQNAAIAG